MLKNYFKSAFRHLLRNKLYAGINVAGLAMGITCTLLAILYWKDEHSFDEFHKNNPHLYRITTSLRTDKEGNRATIGNTGQVQGPAFKAAVPEIKNYVRVFGGDIYTNLEYQNKTLHLRPMFVDASFFDVFTFSFLKGDPANALREINSVVITESTAKKFFNSTEAVGKVLTMESDPSYEILKKPLIVSAVVKDPPGNSSLEFDVLFTFEFMHLSFEDKNWLNTYLGTFVVLHSSARLQAITEKFNAVYAVHAKGQMNNLQFNGGFDPQINYGLQSMTDIHLNTGTATKGFKEGGVINSSSPVYSYAFMGIALFILLMAAINFVNISIAGSLKRAKEVGVRKISGGTSRQIIFQFLTESAMLCFVSFLLAVVLMNNLLPVFNTITGKHLYLSAIIDWKLIIYFSAALLSVILFTGFYPALILSRFKAMEVLYSRQKPCGHNYLGRSLVVFQFALAVFLLVATIGYYSQMYYIRTKDLGYNPSFIIRTEIYGDRDYAPVIDYMKNELVKASSVSIVSFGNNGSTEDMEVNRRSFKAMNKGIDENYLALMQIPLLAGRNISNSVADSRDGAIVNQAFVKAAGLQHPIGEKVLVNRHYDSVYKKIVGVVKDFHFSSLRESIKPVMMYIPDRADGSAGIWVKFDKSNQQKAMAAVERIYKSALPKALYQFDFIDELNAREYMQEQRWQKVINFASALNIVLCSLGLFGLAHLSTNRRIKEIGVRKVLGATVSQVVSLLTGEFLKLVLIALVIATPVAWIVIDKWLQNFAYRIHIAWWMFALAGLIAILIAMATVSLQAIKAAHANPVKSLRTE